MAVSPASAAATLRAQGLRKAEVAAARAARLSALLPDAAAILRELGATHVWAFGSLVHGDPHEESDVDLATTGLSGGAFVTGLGRLSLLFPADVDLVRLESAAESFAARVQTEGRAL